MKKVFMVVSMLVIAVVLLAGCMGGAKVKVDGESVHVETPGGTVDVNGDDGSVKVRSREGDVDINIDGDDENAQYEIKSGDGTAKVVAGKNVGVDGLGVAIYPGAKVEGGMDMSNTDDEESVSMKSVALKTGDPVSKVAEFYKEKLPGANVMDMQPTNNTVMFTKQEETQSISVTVTREEGETETTIAINVVKK